MNYLNKYLKYKTKYFNLKKLYGSGKKPSITFMTYNVLTFNFNGNRDRRHNILQYLITEDKDIITLNEADWIFNTSKDPRIIASQTTIKLKYDISEDRNGKYTTIVLTKKGVFTILNRKDGQNINWTDLPNDGKAKLKSKLSHRGIVALHLQNIISKEDLYVIGIHFDHIDKKKTIDDQIFIRSRVIRKLLEELNYVNKKK